MMTNCIFECMRACLVLTVSVTLLSKSLVASAIGERVTIEGSGTRFAIKGGNLTITCHFNRLADLRWYNSTRHEILAKIGSVHITTSQKQHYYATVSQLELVNITSDMGGTYTCIGGEGSFDVEIFVFDVVTEEVYAETNQGNLSCELTGFTHNFPEIRAYWEIPLGGPIDQSVPGLTVWISKERHFTWIKVNLLIYSGMIYCVFELPSKEGSFFANKSFLIRRGIVPLERGRGRNTHGTIVFLVAVMFVVAMVTINLICNYKTSGRLYDRDLALHGLPSPERVVRV